MEFKFYSLLDFTDKPGPPASVKISQVFADRIKLQWEPPLSDGGAEITNYIVDKRETSRANWAQVTSNINGQITNCSVEKLIEGHEYEFRVSAENKYGVGDPIVTSSVVAKNPYGKYLKFYVTLNNHSVNVLDIHFFFSSKKKQMSLDPVTHLLLLILPKTT